MQKRNWKSALYNYLLAYRVTQNVFTKVPPPLFLNRKITRIKVPTINREIDKGIYQKLATYDKIMKD